MLKQSLSVAVVAGLVCVAAACSNGGGSPTSPSDFSSPAAAPTQPAPAGATIRGTVTAQAAAVAPALRAQGSAGVKVSVVGTALSTVSDDSGHFSIDNVPAGRVELRFEAPGVDAHLEIEHVAENETLEIEVHVSGNQASIGHGDDKTPEPQPEGEVSFTGSIESLSPLRIAGRTVVTSGSTQILDHKNSPIAFSALKVGDNAQVEGTSQSDGSVLAKKIKVED